MKKQKLLAVMAAAILLTACNTDSADNAEEQSVTEASAQVSASVTETSAETAAETEAAAESYTEPEYVEVSALNEFIDFEFIEDYQGTSDIGDLADKAVEFFKTTDEYAESMKNISEFSDGEFSDYIADGVIVPKFNIAYPNDYDGDGKTETFIVVDIPSVLMPTPHIWNFLLFADSSGNIEPDVIDFYEDSSASMLNYGKSKHFIFGGWGGFRSYASIYGVKDGKPVTLYDHCPGGYFCKTDCFLTAFGLQGLSDFMYFDTAVQEYRVIKGVEISRAEMAELDVSNTLCSHCNSENINELPDYVKFHFIKPNYYLLDWGLPGSNLFTYENGVFTLVEDSNITRSSNGRRLDVIAEFDIDKAVAEMKPPVEPYAKVSEDNVFIDYKFIENYQGTTEIGVLAAGAVEFLTESEYYAESTQNIGEFTDEKFKKYFDESGNILPRLQTAYPEDYDGDGSTETFIIVDMPIMQGDQPLVRSFFIFADSRGEMTLLSDASHLFDTLMLDYGDFKQITFGGSGTCGADERNDLYGVVNGKAKHLYGMRGEFFKKDCFLSAFGAQGGGAFMYYDTAACEYRAIAGEDIPIEKIKEMDTSNALSEFYEWYDEHGFLYAELIGGRYYVIIQGAMDTGTVYLYENGKFIQNEDCEYVRDSHYSGIDNVVLDIDITKAIAEMKSVK